MQHWRNKLCGLDKFSEIHPFCYCKSWCNNRCVVDIRGSTISPTEIPGMSAGLRMLRNENEATLNNPMNGHQVWRNGNSHDVPLGVQESRRFYLFHMTCWQDTGGHYGFDVPAGRRQDFASQSRENWTILSSSEHWFPVHPCLDFSKQLEALKPQLDLLWGFLAIVWIKSQQEWLFGETVQACLACGDTVNDIVSA